MVRSLTAMLWVAGSLCAVAIICGLVHMLIYQFFLRAVAVAMRKSGVAGSITGMLITSFLLVVGSLGTMALIVFVIIAAINNIDRGGGRRGIQEFVGAMGILGGLGVCVLAVLGLTWVIWYIINLILVRNAITERVG